MGKLSEEKLKALAVSLTEKVCKLLNEEYEELCRREVDPLQAFQVGAMAARWAAGPWEMAGKMAWEAEQVATMKSGVKTG